MASLIICTAGQARSGKNSIGEYLIKKLPGFESAAFAKPVKDIFSEAFGADADFIEKWKVTNEVPSGFGLPIRKSLQFIGDGFRTIKGDVWVDYAIRKNANKNVCYMDGRYINELRKVREMGGINVLLWREGYENNDPNKSESQIKVLVDWFLSKRHEGEVNQDILQNAPEGAELVDLFIHSGGTLDDLYRKADEIVLPYVVKKWYNKLSPDVIDQMVDLAKKIHDDGDRLRKLREVDHKFLHQPMTI